MNYHLYITDTAEKDISRAVDYIDFVLKNPKAADALLEETDQKINALLPFPLEHPVVEDKLLAAWGVRFLQIKNYFAFYVVEESHVTVIRFLYAKSDWGSILRGRRFSRLGLLFIVCLHSPRSLSARAPISQWFFHKLVV